MADFRAISDVSVVQVGLCDLICADCRDVLRVLPDNSIDSVVCDPPYDLNILNKKWDRTRVAFDVSLWQQVLRVVKPGAHILVFGHPRTYHRMACAVEDAGFRVRDQVQWLTGQGWPKGKNNLDDGLGTGLKCAAEPICLARKPLSERTLEANIARWGTGALNIEVSRIPSGGGTSRWPSNLLLEHGFGCTDLECEDGCPIVELNVQSGYSETKRIEKPSNCGGDTWGGTIQTKRGARGHTDAGGASRFFWCSKPSPNERTANDTVENEHVSVKPVRLMAYLCRLVTPPEGLVLDPFMGSGSTGVAAVQEGFALIGIESDLQSFETAVGRIGHRGTRETRPRQVTGVGICKIHKTARWSREGGD